MAYWYHNINIYNFIKCLNDNETELIYFLILHSYKGYPLLSECTTLCIIVGVYCVLLLSKSSYNYLESYYIWEVNYNLGNSGNT